MADVAELFGGPPAVDQNGNLTIWAVKTPLASLAAPKVTELGGATAFRITYSFVSGGWVLTMPQSKNADPRLLAPVVKESLGVLTPALAELKYVDSAAAGSAAVVLTEGLWDFVERRNIDQKVVATVGQPVRAMRLNLGPQVPGPTDGAGKFSLTQAVAIESITVAPVLLVA